MAFDSTIADASRILRAGGLVAFPTETVYGLGADADNPAALARMFAAKGRPADHPVIVHLADASQLPDWAREIPPAAQKLARAFWPGPLSLILPRAARVLDQVTGGQETVGLRIPSHPVAQELLKAFGCGVAAPSANRFGRVSPTQAAHVREELGSRVDLVLEGADCAVGLESTIVDLSRGAARLLRPGAITREQLEFVLDEPLEEPGQNAPRASGRLASHYAPQAELRIVPAEERLSCAIELAQGPVKVALLAPAETSTPPNVCLVPLNDEPELFAQQLYAAFRQVDKLGCQVAVVSPPPATGLGEAILDRLHKAAAPRPVS
jgi:L-threonylcarbamoyladenylate synthase